MEGMAEQPHDFHEVNEFGINFSNIGAPWKENMVELIQGVLQSWTETDGLQQMIHHNTTRIGCSYYMLPTDWSLKVLCLYDNRPQRDGQSERYFGPQGATTSYILATVKNSSTSGKDNCNTYYDRTSMETTPGQQQQQQLLYIFVGMLPLPNDMQLNHNS
ncbi:hypothetical protein Y032_0147g2566 [Ancylostoma ceylanicum]|uniref:Uncharacterized protein n=1 Tax=Ancylostoma ceylanicum TaxID=53326 RepID=A0A016T2A1_9BILA|nr:hypothetical protein Y032_0147g2566 [Ancylostoma ceylanicum]